MCKLMPVTVKRGTPVAPSHGFPRSAPIQSHPRGLGIEEYAEAGCGIRLLAHRTRSKAQGRGGLRHICEARGDMLLALMRSLFVCSVSGRSHRRGCLRSERLRPRCAVGSPPRPPRPGLTGCLCANGVRFGTRRASEDPLRSVSSSSVAKCARMCTLMIHARARKRSPQERALTLRVHMQGRYRPRDHARG